MASDYLIKTIQGYDNYIEQKGIDESVMNAYIKACEVAINGEKDIPYGLQLTKRFKGEIERFCISKTGGTIWDLDYYKHKNEIDQGITILDSYFELFLLESHFLFESFMVYMEKNRAP